MALVLAAWAVPATAAPEACPSDDTKPTVKMNVSMGDPVIDHTRSQEGIAAMHSDSPEMSGGDEWRRVGLTHATLEVSAQSGLLLMPRRGKEGLCGRVEEVTVGLGFPRMVIYVPTQYPRGSCAYREIVEHEYQHVAAHRRTLEQHRGTFKREIQQALDALSPFAAASEDAARERVNAVISEAFARARAAFRRDQQVVNNAIDTEREYRAIQRRCDDW